VISRSGWLPSWLRHWAADSAALLLSQFTAIAATSALAILLARHLGPKDWGIFSGFLGLSLALSIFVEFGLTQWLLRELSQLSARYRPGSAPHAVRARSGEMVVATLTVNVALGATMVIGAGVATVVLRLQTTSSFLLLSLVGYGALLAACSGLEAVFRARRRVTRVVTATLLEKGLLLVLVAVFLVLGLDLVAIGVAYLLAGGARIGFDSFMIARDGDLVLCRPSVGTAWRAARRSVPFALNRASLNIIPKLDTFILSALSPVAAGYFALGDRALGPVLIIPVVMSSALYPFLARESPGSTAGRRLVGLLGAAGGLIGAIGIVLAPRLVPLVFGSDYTHAVRVVQVMLVTVPFVFAANPLLAHLYTSRLEQRALGLGLGGVSCLGTAAIVLGQVVAGPVGAACGYVARSMLFVAVLAVATGGAFTRAARPVRPQDFAGHAGREVGEPTSAPSTGGIV
jgi:O-antigen/teichoic acid export membrane protein